MTDNKTLNNFFGRNVSYADEKTDTYERLRNDTLSPFKGMTMGDIFVYAAVFGFKNRRREKIEKAKPNISAVALSDKQTALLLAISIAETGGIDILFQNDAATRVIEEYANGGIDILESELIGNVDEDAIAKMFSTMKTLIADWEAK